MAYEEKEKKEFNLKILKHKSLTQRYRYEIDSFSASIEPAYFWLMDFLGKRALQYKISKIGEHIGASVVSQFFGEMSTRRTALEKRGTEILMSVNAVVRSIINLLYDLREFDRRLTVYDDLYKGADNAENADMALKRIWMDEVDVKKGNASINVMTAQRGLEFVTLRDAFMIAKTPKQAGDMDLNDRVKRILKGRLEEYVQWKVQSEKELRQRRKIELSYLRSQVDSLRLYSQWAKPYLKAAQMLQFKEVDITDPELIQAFDQNVIDIKIRGVKEVYLKEFIKFLGGKRGYKPPVTISQKEQEALKFMKVGPKAYSVIDVSFVFRTKPSLIQQTQAGGVYRQLGKLTIEFEGYTFTPEEYKKLEKAEEYEAMKFIEGLTSESLVAMREDLEKYLGELDLDKKKEEEKKKKKAPLLDTIFSSISAIKGAGSEGFSVERLLKFGFDQGLLEQRAKKIAIEQNIRNIFDLYDVFKKSNRLLSFPYPPDFVSETKRASKPAK